MDLAADNRCDELYSCSLCEFTLAYSQHVALFYLYFIFQAEFSERKTHQ